MALDRTVKKEIQRIFNDRDQAILLLEEFGYPVERIPEGNGEAFWTVIFREMDRGIVNQAPAELVRLAADRYPGNPVFAEFRAPQSKPGERRGSSIIVPNIVNQPETVTMVRDVAQNMGITLHPAFTAQDQLCFHLEADVPINQVRALAGQISERLAQQGLDFRVGSTPYRDYLLGRLLVEGPDQGRFELTDIPASTRAGDLGAAVIAEGYVEETLPKDKQGQPRPHTVDRMGPNGNQRLDPNLSLHENGVQDGDNLNVAPEGTAGMLNPTFRNEALVRARLQIMRFHSSHSWFKVRANARQRPTLYQFNFPALGWGPPQPGGGPYPQDQHEVTMEMLPAFPLKAPLVIWNSPIYHPNIDPKTGGVCLGALMENYRPAMNLGDLCQMIFDLASYRNYEVPGLNPDAVQWVFTPEGQIAIEQRGGICLLRKWVEQQHQPRPLKVRRL